MKNAVCRLFIDSCFDMCVTLHKPPNFRTIRTTGHVHIQYLMSQ